MEATAEWAQPHVYSQDGTYPRNIDAYPGQPYRTLFYRTYSEEAGAEGSFLFPVYLEQKVANYNPAIVQQIWERYRANSGSGGLDRL